jgi:phosphatidylserine decarboxylase
MSELMTALPQYLLPKLALTRAAGAAARAQAGARTTAVIRWFIRRYGVDMSEAAQPDPAAYASFNDFFTRALKPGARPLADVGPDGLLCPVDGAISQFGALQCEHIFQAKGHRYTAAALLGGDDLEAARYRGGHFATLYLSPRDYHRIHMPCAGTLRRMVHVPGALFSVNPATARAVPGLFARNERVVCHFDDAAGRPFVLVLVGATIVGSMATVWHGVVNPPRPGTLQRWDYAPGQVALAAGAEMGRFLLGSTVVMLFPADAPGDTAGGQPGTVLRFNPAWAPGGPIRMGQMMATRERGAA